MPGTASGKLHLRQKAKSQNGKEASAAAVCIKDCIPVFMKEDLLPIMGEAQMVQEFPPAFYRVLEEQKTWRK